MIDYIHSEQFFTKKKDIVITGNGVSLTNSDIYAESMELHESISMEENLAFGSCNASEFRITIANNVSSLIGKRISVIEIIDGDILNPFELGTYTVVSDIPTAERDRREITAYDDLYLILNTEVSEWYTGLTFPMTLKNFRDSFFNYLGITQDSATLINDNITIEETITPTTLYGSDVITRICEINACFGRMGRNGHFQYITLGGTATDVSNNAIELKYEDYQTEFIDKVQIRQNPDDVGGISGTGTNALIIENNFLMYGKTANELNSISATVLNAVSSIQYTPIEIELNGTPCMETGDKITFSDGTNTITSYVLERTLRGIQTLFDSIYANGQPIRSEVTTLNTEIEQALGRVNALVRTVEETTSQVSNLEDEVQSLVTQTASQISAKVDKVGGNASSFGWNLGATSFTLTSNGSTVFEAKSSGVKITGNLTATSGYIGSSSQGFTINSSSFYNGTSSMSSNYDGVYIGTDGINVAGKFKVTYLGVITLNGIADINFGTGFVHIEKNLITNMYSKIKSDAIGSYSATSSYYTEITSAGLVFGNNSSGGFIKVGSTNKAQFTNSAIGLFGNVHICNRTTDTLAFFGTSGSSKKTVSGSTDSAKLSSLITALKAYNLIG